MKTYWITGASSGLGQALAQELSLNGHQLILSARNLSRLESLKQNSPYPDRIQLLPFDLADYQQAPEIVAQALKLFSKIDIVILNAGIAQRSLAQETSIEVYKNLMDVNYLGNIALTQELLKEFMRVNDGQFVIISSLVGKFGTPYRSGYSASKHALHGYFDSLRAEMKMQKFNIDVTIICPGFVSTEISFNALSGNGDATRVYDERNAKGLTPKDFATKAIKVINSKTFEANIGGKETLGVLIKRLLPSVFAKLIAKVRVR
jgi:short-subunit dehydrogenase